MVKKWYGLIDKIYNIANLLRAFSQVKKNKGMSGIDGVFRTDRFAALFGFGTEIDLAVA